MIADNINGESNPEAEEPWYFDISSFLPADHGCILITIRLPSLKDIKQSTNTTRLVLEQALELLSNESGLSRATKG